jgi:hypothetical protein
MPVTGRIGAQHAGPGDFVNTSVRLQGSLRRKTANVEKHLLDVGVAEYHPGAAALVVENSLREHLPIPRINVGSYGDRHFLFAFREQLGREGGGHRHSANLRINAV